MDVVVVESPAKAKTINKYLGPNFRVLASYGHVRDLPPKDGSVKPDDGFSMSWEVAGDSKKRVDAIAEALDGAEHLYLATDPDREGEAISWHVQEVLNQRKALDNIDVKRVVFHEITKSAVLDAIAHPREVNQDLVEAYLARRALDYLVGFTLSPVLWRKLPGSRSAGRVQSVALRLICDRESEIEIFKPQEYWSVTANFTTLRNEAFTARLTHLNGERLKRLELTDETAANAAKQAIESRNFSVGEIEKKTVRRNPAPPFTTSTMQQEASRKLGFSASRTMQTAQKLYEGVTIDGETVGLITYMRTDSVTLSGEAIAASRNLIKSDYGDNYLPDSPRVYKTKSKNAQEAHEAIRPTDFFRRPNQVASLLDEGQRKLYELIWKRTVACEMESAVFDQVAADLTAPDGQVTLRANGSVMKFDGFLKLYQEGQDDQSGDDDKNKRLPAMEKNEPVERQQTESEQHFTQPPPRYTEASLVKKMEELGIGRPSTYASILKVLQDRNYVKLEKRRFEAEDRGRVVTAFLANFFQRYVDYDFTAELEEQLDDISGGAINWRKVLEDFWGAFSAAVDGTKDLRISEVLDRLDEDLGPHFFGDGPNGEGEAARKCPGCEEGRLNLKLGRYGAFIGCNKYPDCRYTKQLAVAGSDSDTAEGDAAVAAGPKLLGTDPDTGLDVTLRKGPYGFYVQLGEELPKEKGKKAPPKPKRASVPRHFDPAALDLETALGLLSLPREVGPHPESGRMITAGIGRFGPYIKHGSIYVSLKEDDVLTIGLNRAVTLFAEAPSSGARELGDHPRDGKPITIRKGRWGPYVKHGRVNASLPDTVGPEELTLDQAVQLLDERVAKNAEKKATGKKSSKKSPKKKTASKKKAAPKKKSAAKKKKAADDTSADPVEAAPESPAGK
ncbi:MAG: DNA topoisomerase I [Rhodospirillaceae bacterium]|nr:DNA topoisomerase I [Rhodospirillaceae bacterium]